MDSLWPQPRPLRRLARCVSPVPTAAGSQRIGWPQPPHGRLPGADHLWLHDAVLQCRRFEAWRGRRRTAPSCRLDIKSQSMAFGRSRCRACYPGRATSSRSPLAILLGQDRGPKAFGAPWQGSTHAASWSPKSPRAWGPWWAPSCKHRRQLILSVGGAGRWRRREGRTAPPPPARQGPWNEGLWQHEVGWSDFEHDLGEVSPRFSKRPEAVRMASSPTCEPCC